MVNRLYNKKEETDLDFPGFSFPAIIGSMVIAVEGPQNWGFTTEIPKEPDYFR